MSYDGASSSDSGGPSVLMDETAEDVTTFDVAEWVPGDGRSWRLEPDAAVGPSRVVVLDVDVRHVVELVMGEDQQVIETLGSHGLHPAFGKCIRPRCPHWRANGLDPFGPENLVKGSGELGVTVSDQESDGALGLLEIPGEFPGHLGHPLAVRSRRDAEEVYDTTLDLDDEQGVVALSIHRVNVEEVGGQYAVGLGSEEVRPGRSLPARSGRKPMAVADPATRRLRSSPMIAGSPAGVLPCQSTDQLNLLVGKRWTAGSRCG